MDEKQLIAFRMKYQGNTNEKIAEATGFTKSTIETYFSAEGSWKATYDLWANRESEASQEKVHKALQGVLEIAGSILVDALVRAKEVVEKYKQELKSTTNPKKIADVEWSLQKAEERATNLAERVMDRAGMSIVARAKIEKNITYSDNYDEVVERLITAGIDPTSIQYRDNSPQRTNGVLPN